MLQVSVFSNPPILFPAQFFPGNTFQNRSVQSPAPVTIVLPSGLMAKYSTRYVCPVSVAIFSIRGYFQILISLCEYPCVLTISFKLLLNMRLQICEPASIVLRVVPVKVFLKRIVRSAVPPPDTNNPCWWGDQVMALTAATWSLYLSMGQQEWAFQTNNLLSLPPEHSCCSSQLHFSPQISCLWPTSLLTKAALTLRSRCNIFLSREPVLTMLLFQAIAPTRLVWPCKVRARFILLMSHSCTSPLFVPKASSGPFRDQDTEVAQLDCPKSHSLLTLELAAFHRYTLEASPTARQF